MLEINYVAVLVAVVANFFLGYLWYTPLFGKVWAKEMGYDLNEKPNTGVMIQGMIYMVIGNFFLAYVFAHNIIAWSFVPGMEDMGPLGNIVNSALFTWLGFYVPGHLGATVWEKKSWTLTIINGGYHLAALFVVASILILM